MSLLEDVDSLLATILVTNNLVNICIVILTSNIIDTIFTFHSATFEFVVKSVLVTFLLLLFGEILPKVFSQGNPRGFARFVVYPIKLFRIIFCQLAGEDLDDDDFEGTPEEKVMLYYKCIVSKDDD